MNILKNIRNIKKKDFNSIRNEKLLDYWLYIRQMNCSLHAWFKSNGYKSVVIYGARELGHRLYYEVKDDLEMSVYFVDKMADELPNAEMEVMMPWEIQDQIDVVVITQMEFYRRLNKEMKKYFNCTIVSIEQVVYETKVI